MADKTRQVSNLVDLLRFRSRQSGSKRVFSFLRVQDEPEVSMTYGQLHDRAVAIAAELQAQAVRGDCVLMLFPPGLDFIEAFFGCLYAGMVAVPASPPRRKRPTTSLESVFTTAKPAVVLSTAAHFDEAARLYRFIPELLDRPWIATDRILPNNGRVWEDPHVDAEELAFLQFTSGSTSAPKGVMLSHQNLMHNSALIDKGFGNRQDSSAVSWLPLYHDMGLIGGVLQPIYCGGASTLLAPTAFLHRPLLWLETISRTRATVSGGPDFAYDLCARSVRNGDCRGLDLSCWEVAFSGAEPVQAATLERFASMFQEVGFRREAFYPCYGLAEATLMVTGGPRSEPPTVISLDATLLARNRAVEADARDPLAKKVVASGGRLPGQEVVIVDAEQRRRCPDGTIGEVWVRGGSVASGYLDRPEATEETFNAHIADSGEGPFLRTGDLGFLRDDRLFITGRLKDLIIIRGCNYYPEDIEQTVQTAYAGFRPGHCAAFGIDVEDRESLVIMQEIEPRLRDLNTEAAFQAIRQSVADRFELEVHAVILARAGTIPKTTSGKLRRADCRKLYLCGQQDVIAHWTATDVTDESELDDLIEHANPRSVTAGEIEQWLIERIAARAKIPRSQVQTRTPFMEFGMGSLDGVQIAADLGLWLGRSLSPTAVYNHPNIADLAGWLAKSPEPEMPVAVPIVEYPDAPESALDDDDLLRKVQALSEEEQEAYILQEMAKQDGT